MARDKMAVDFTSQEISQKYDRFARWYDWIEGIPEVLGVTRLRGSFSLRLSYVSGDNGGTFWTSDGFLGCPDVGGLNLSTRGVAMDKLRVGYERSLNSSAAIRRFRGEFLSPRFSGSQCCLSVVFSFARSVRAESLMFVRFRGLISRNVRAAKLLHNIFIMLKNTTVQAKR